MNRIDRILLAYTRCDDITMEEIAAAGITIADVEAAFSLVLLDGEVMDTIPRETFRDVVDEFHRRILRY